MEVMCRVGLFESERLVIRVTERERTARSTWRRRLFGADQTPSNPWMGRFYPSVVGLCAFVAPLSDAS